MTQPQLARRADVSQTTLFRFEGDPVRGLSVESLEKIARALGTHPAVLVGLTDDRQREELAAAIRAAAATPMLPPDESELLETYRNLDASMQAKARELLHVLSDC